MSPRRPWFGCERVRRLRWITAVSRRWERKRSAVGLVWISCRVFVRFLAAQLVTRPRYGVSKPRQLVHTKESISGVRTMVANDGVTDHLSDRPTSLVGGTVLVRGVCRGVG